MTLIINELSMKAIRGSKSEPASLNNNAELHHNVIQDIGILIHEHSFIPARAKEEVFLLSIALVVAYTSVISSKAL